MATVVTGSKLHWNYYIALERDLEEVSRYIEFCNGNMQVFSIELARLLFAAASEVDVVAKLLCEVTDRNAKRNNIDGYRKVIAPSIQELVTTKVYIERYGIEVVPWSSWSGEENPKWWRSYNNVKHQRSSFFHEATLENAINAMGALLVVTVYLYSRLLVSNGDAPLSIKDTTYELRPEPSLLRLHEDDYYSALVG